MFTTYAGHMLMAIATPNSRILLSAINGLVCDIVVAEGNIMCGEQFSTQPTVRRYPPVWAEHMLSLSYTVSSPS